MILSQAAQLGGSSTTVTNVAPAGGPSGRRLLGLPRCCPDFSVNLPIVASCQYAGYRAIILGLP